MARHNTFGKNGETVACELLISKGYIIRERNWRCGKNEIDIVAEKGDRLIIVEVKTRSHEIPDISQIITRKKISHLIAAGNAYQNMFKLPLKLQFDIVLLTGPDENSLSAEHIEDAFMPPLKTY